MHDTAEYTDEKQSSWQRILAMRGIRLSDESCLLI